MNLDFWQSALFFLTAIVSGAVNSIAGGGTFLLFPVLNFGGLSALSANIMCSVAMWPGSVASCFAYRKEIKTPISSLIPLLLCGIVGSIVGSFALLVTSEAYFTELLPFLLLAAAFIFTFGRKISSLLRREHLKAGQKTGIAFMFIIAAYGGYFGAGIGIIMLAFLQLLGYRDIHEMNGLKTVLAGTINAVAVAIFLFSATIDWSIAWIVIVGGIVGGYFGTKLALRISPEKARKIVVIIAWIMVVYFFLERI